MVLIENIALFDTSMLDIIFSFFFFFFVVSADLLARVNALYQDSNISHKWHGIVTAMVNKHLI